MATALGGGATINNDGSVSAPSYEISGNTYNDVGSAFQAVDESYRSPSKTPYATTAYGVI